MLYLDHADCSFVSEQLYQCDSIEHDIWTFQVMRCLILLSLFFFNILRSFRACMHVCVNTIQYNTIQYNTIQFNTIQYNTIQYNTIQYNITLLSRKREICVQRSSKCVQRSSKVFVHAYESGRNKTHACLLCIQNMNLLKVNVSGKSNPPLRWKLVTGLVSSLAEANSTRHH